MNNFNELILSNFKKEHSEQLKNYPNERSEFCNVKPDKFMHLDNLINFRSYKVHLFRDDMAFDNKRTTFMFLVDTFEELGFEFVISNLNKKNVGNCENSYKLKGNFFDRDLLFQIHFFSDLVKFVFDKKKIKTVCEIGGGFGQLARIILNNYDCKFFIMDLPDANILSSYYLHENFPQKKIYIYDNYLKEKDGFVSSDSIENFDIFILPSWAKFNDELKIDLFINTRSMTLMKFAVIKKYFNIIHKYISNDGFFLNINDYSFEEMKLPERSTKLKDYPYDDNWEVKLSKKSFYQHHIHLLLTQREFSNFKNNIKDEIEKIKIESKKYQLTWLSYIRRKLKSFMVNKFLKFFKILFKKSFLRKLGYKLLSLE